MLSTLISFITSQKACRKQIEIIKNEFINSLEKSEEKNKLASATNILNYFSIIFFILGVIFLTIFCALNISIKEESKMSQKDKIDGGYVPPTKPIKPDEHGYAPPKPPQKPPEPPAKPVKK
jgi:preprotein translocase subunit SecG